MYPSSPEWIIAVGAGPGYRAGTGTFMAKRLNIAGVERTETTKLAKMNWFVINEFSPRARASMGTPDMGGTLCKNS
jgi:hypothetical protein